MSALPDIPKGDFATLALALVNRYWMLRHCHDPTKARSLMHDLVKCLIAVNADIADLVEHVSVKLDASQQKTASSPPPREPSQ